MLPNMLPFKLDMYNDSGSESEYVSGSDYESVSMNDYGPDGFNDADLSGALGLELECGSGSDFNEAGPLEVAEVVEADEVEAEIQRFETCLTDVDLGSGKNGAGKINDTAIEDDDSYNDGYDNDYDDDNATLFGGNRNPPEYYKRRMKSMDEAMYDRKEYSDGTERAIASAHEQWSR